MKKGGKSDSGWIVDTGQRMNEQNTHRRIKKKNNEISADEIKVIFNEMVTRVISFGLKTGRRGQQVEDKDD